MIPFSHLRSLLGVGLLISACGRASVPEATTTSAAVPASTTLQPSRLERPATGRAYNVILQATSCWLGGLWSDAVGEKGDARGAGIRRRCDALLRTVGESPAGAYNALVAVDAATVEIIAEHVQSTARADERDGPHSADLVALLRGVAAASRETARARHAADKVKQVFETAPSATDRSDHKRMSVPALRSAGGLHALLEHGGPYADDARVVGILHTIDRMEIARGLPKHLKVYAVEGANLDVFGVQAPELYQDAALPIPTGTWLAYLTKVASAAGHPVPPEAKSPQNREPLAWNGVLEGLADRIRHPRTDPALDAVARDVVARIDQQATSEREAFEAHAPEDR
jgi:hypothetical protein